MNNLSALTQHELAQVDAALTLIDAALVMLQERGICDADQGIDLIELNEAVGAEIEFRADKDGRYKALEAVEIGAAVMGVRPDGEVGYAPRG